jgi:hypothetical protein
MDEDIFHKSAIGINSDSAIQDTPDFADPQIMVFYLLRSLGKSIKQRLRQ